MVSSKTDGARFLKPGVSGSGTGFAHVLMTRKPFLVCIVNFTAKGGRPAGRFFHAAETCAGPICCAFVKKNNCPNKRQLY
jgi:hypothetical protein